MLKQLSVVLGLGFSSGLPLALVGSTLQAWFASTGLSLFATTFLSLLGLPYLCRVIPGPILDRYTLFSLGRRRSWILTMQILLFSGINVLALLNPATQPALMVVIAFFLASFSATQDVAIDAQRIEYLPVSWHGMGASLAVCGYRFAMMLSGGLALILASNYGFSVTYQLMSLFMGLGILSTLLSREPSHPKPLSQGFAKSFTQPLSELARRPGIHLVFCFVLLYKLGEAFTATTSGVVMPFLIQGPGFSLDTIGYINKLLGITAILTGGILAGFILLRCALYPSLLAFGLFQAVANGFFVALAFKGKSIPLLALAVLFDNLAAGMTSTALVTFFMRIVNKSYTATQFSLFVAISTLPRIFSGPLAALIVPFAGWTGLYQIACVMALAFLPFLMKIKDRFFLENEKENSSCLRIERNVS